MNSTKSPKPLKTIGKAGPPPKPKRLPKELRELKRAPKDPNAPKKALTAFLLFSGDKRAELRAHNPNWKITEVAKECGRLWRESDDGLKEKYQKLAEEEKKLYEQRLQDYIKGQNKV